MNTVVTSKEEILKTSRELIRQKGWGAVNIRSVAAACGVSVGSIYNYFESKAELVGETVESIWCEIFRHPQQGMVFEDIQECIRWMYERMEYGCKASGVKEIRIHDLRHSHVSLLIDLGYSAVAIGQRVGHESVEITYRYAHLFPTVQKDMAEKLNQERSA